MKPIDFATLISLVEEADDRYGLEGTIEYLAMQDIPMTDAVIALGVACGILLPGYKNGWSKEELGL